MKRPVQSAMLLFSALALAAVALWAGIAGRRDCPRTTSPPKCFAGKSDRESSAAGSGDDSFSADSIAASSFNNGTSHRPMHSWPQAGAAGISLPPRLDAHHLSERLRPTRPARCLAAANQTAVRGKVTLRYRPNLNRTHHLSFITYHLSLLLLPPLGDFGLHELQPVGGQLALVLRTSAARSSWPEAAFPATARRPRSPSGCRSRSRGARRRFRPSGRCPRPACCGRSRKCGRGPGSPSSARIAAGVFFSSMCEWNVSYIILQRGWFTSRQKRAPSAAVFSR